MAIQLERRVAKKKPDSAETPADENPVKAATFKVAADLAHKAKYVANHKGLKLQKYIDGLLRGAIERDYEQFRKEIGA